MSKQSRFPDTLVLIFCLVVVAQLLTYILEPGTFLREPKPESGDTYVEPKGAAPLRERLTAALESRGIPDAKFAELLQISKRTVRKWKIGPPKEGETVDPAKAGVHIEATIGAILQKWVTNPEYTPTDDEIKQWKKALEKDHVRQVLVPGTYKTNQERAAEAEAKAKAARAKAGESGEPEPEKKKSSGPSWYAPLTVVFTAIPRGLTNSDAVQIIIFVFLIGGVISVMRATGAFDALIGAAIRGFGERANLLIGGTIGLFAFGSGLIGMAEEYVPFIALLVTMSLALKLDAMVGISIVFVGYAIGYGCAPFNPFTVIIAQGIADLKPTSGWAFRFAVMAICLFVGIHHVVRYARRIRENPEQSLVSDIDYSEGFTLPDNVPLTPPRMGVLLAFAVTVILFVYGVAQWDWYLMELSAIFLALGVVVAIIGRVSPNAAAKAFCHGAGELTTTALLIGFARSIEIVLVDAQVIDTVVHSIAQGLGGLPKEVGAVGMLAVQTLCNFFIPSGSGQAYVTMPIMAPLATELGIQKQVAVLAYQFGDGFTNVITPTNAAFMGMLAMARVPYQRWLKFAIPLMIKLYTIAAIALIVAVWIGYS